VKSLGFIYRQLCDDGRFSSFDVRELLVKTLGLTSHHGLLTNLDKPFVSNDLFTQGLKRLERGEPIAYIVESSEFMGLTMRVNFNVLIPRPETEELVQHVIDRLKIRPSITKVLDLGTGSGAIACSLKKNMPHLEVMASDISESALELARHNAAQHTLTIDYRVGDAFVPWQDTKIQAIIANPPYILRREDAERSVDAYEPHMALYTTMEDNLYQACIDRFAYYPELECLAFELNKDWVIPVEMMIKNSSIKLSLEWFEDMNRHLRFAWIERNKVQ
jgi:release factor glutamine methyltransferase